MLVNRDAVTQEEVDCLMEECKKEIIEEYKAERKNIIKHSIKEALMKSDINELSIKRSLERIVRESNENLSSIRGY
jgi:hypothetical protein